MKRLEKATLHRSARRAATLLFALVIVLMSFSLGFGFSTLLSGHRYVDDAADLMTAEEEAQLEAKLEEINSRLQFDVVIVTVDTTGTMSTTDYADKYFEDNGYGQGPNRDGILLLVSYEDGRWATSTSGYGITALTDYGLDQIESELVDNLNKGKFYQAFDSFAQRCDEYVTSAKEGNIIDVGNEPKKPFPWASRGLIAIAAGLFSGFAGTSSARAQLKTVRYQPRAGNYVVRDSFALDPRASRDLFLYSNITRVPRVQQSNNGPRPGGSTTHVSPGGMTHGGHSGSFRK